MQGQNIKLGASGWRVNNAFFILIAMRTLVVALPYFGWCRSPGFPDYYLSATEVFAATRGPAIMCYGYFYPFVGSWANCLTHRLRAPIELSSKFVTYYHTFCHEESCRGRAARTPIPFV
ncbi:hypothetical protein F5Y03DRAFT_119369 [Xylaria venustula]|nr:hypothetical protein F5Y03DRAFT_119369 [Xylaria venustula]